VVRDEEDLRSRLRWWTILARRRDGAGRGLTTTSVGSSSFPRPFVPPPRSFLPLPPPPPPPLSRVAWVMSLRASPRLGDFLGVVSTAIPPVFFASSSSPSMSRISSSVGRFFSLMTDRG